MILIFISSNLYADHNLMHFDKNYREFSCDVNYEVDDNSSIEFIFSGIDVFSNEKIIRNRADVDSFSEHAYMVYFETGEENVFMGYQFLSDKNLGVTSGSMTELLNDSFKTMFVADGRSLTPIENSDELDYGFTFIDGVLVIKAKGVLINKLRTKSKYISFLNFEYQFIPLRCNPG